MSSHTITDRRGCDAATLGAGVQIVLLRHAQAGLHGRFCGHSNPGLIIEGQQQLPSILEGLSHFAPRTILSSDLRRAQETAAPIAKHFAMDYTTSPAFREMNFGRWEGLTWNEVEAQYPDGARAWTKLFPRHRPPQGECFAELQARAASQLELLAATARPGCTLVVTHAGFIRAAVAWALGMPEDRISRLGQNYGALTILERLGTSHWTLSAFNICLASSTRAASQKIKDSQ